MESENKYIKIMAANTGTNKRIPVKWVRDRAKAAYDKKEFCYICNSIVDLELHHTHSITLLLNAWSIRKSYDISTDEGILAVRDEFIEEHRIEIYDNVFTLCNKHHIVLHSIYGKAPSLASAPKQERWIELQKSKWENPGEPTKAISLSNFSAFY
jgi:5-methylcytosine-specific restriction endonuclease McrA